VRERACVQWIVLLFNIILIVLLLIYSYITSFTISECQLWILIHGDMNIICFTVSGLV